MEISNNVSRVAAFIQGATAAIAFGAGVVAILESFPTPPLFDTEFIYRTLWPLAATAATFGIIGLLLTPLTFRGRGWREWVFVTSVVLAAIGFVGGLVLIRLTNGSS